MNTQHNVVSICTDTHAHARTRALTHHGSERREPWRVYVRVCMRVRARPGVHMLASVCCVLLCLSLARALALAQAHAQTGHFFAVSIFHLYFSTTLSCSVALSFCFAISPFSLDLACPSLLVSGQTSVVSVSVRARYLGCGPCCRRRRGRRRRPCGRLLGGLVKHTAQTRQRTRTHTRTHAHAHPPTTVLKGENHGGCTCACACVCVRAQVCTC